MSNTLVGRRARVRANFPDFFNPTLLGRVGTIVEDNREEPFGQIVVLMDRPFLTPAELSLRIREDGTFDERQMRTAFFSANELEVTSC